MIQQNKKSISKKHYRLESSHLVLVPYKRSFVQEYHSWFSEYPQLLHLTGSEPLTIEQEFQNHRSWLDDPSKYTFLVFHKQNNKMIGDVNLFFSQWIQPNEAEINIMIARPQFRGKGFSKEIIQVIQLFALGLYNKDTIIAKIKQENIASIKFFEKSGYKFIQDNKHYQQKQYRKIAQISQENAYNLLQTVYKLSEESDIESLYS